MKNHNLKVALFLRYPRRSANFSIERLFRVVSGQLADQGILALEKVCPYLSNGLLNRLRSILWAVMNREQVNHVTGDVNFLGLLLPRKRTILTIHDSASLKRLAGIKRWIYIYLWIRLPVWHAARVTTISNAARQEILEIAPWAADKLLVIPNCLTQEVDLEPSKFNHSYPRILHIGTKPNKNLARVARALQGLACKLVVVGPLSIQDRDVLDGCNLDYENHENQSDSEISAEYRRCDLVMFPSLYEGFGLPILEAQAVGRPVITSSREPMVSVAGQDACVVNPESVEEIRKAVIRLTNDSEYRDLVVSAGRSNIRRYLPHVIAEQYAALYREISRLEKTA